MSLWKTIAVFCFLLALGVEYSHARPVYTRLDATVGSKVAIPCKVRTDRLSGASSVKLEWGMTPEGGGLYTPLLYDDVKNLQKNHMDCGIIIDSIRYRDSGTYEGRFIMDNVPYQPFKVVIVHVTDPTSTETADTETFKKHQRNLGIQWETPDPETVWEDQNNQETEWETPPVTSTETADTETVSEDQRNVEIQTETPSVTSTETADTETVKEDESNVEIQRETPSVTSTETTNTETVKEDESNVEIQRETPSVTSTETTNTETVKEDESNVEIQRETPPVTSTEEVPMMSPTMITTMETSTYNTGLVLIDLCVKLITETFYQLKRNGYLPLVCILAGVGHLVVIIISIVGYLYCKKRRREINFLKLAEEGRLEMNGGSPQIKGGSQEMEGVHTMREGDAKEDDVIVEIEGGCTAKDETHIMMEQSGDMEEGITERNEMQIQVQELAVREEQLAVREEILAKMQEIFAQTQGERSVREILAETQGKLSETKNELAVKEKELTETKEILSGLKKKYLKTLLGIEGDVTAMDEELAVTKEQLSAAKN